MNKNKYRLIIAMVVFAVTYLLIFFGDKTNLSSVASVLMKDYVVNASLPTYTFMSDVDNNSDFNLVDSILNDIYPMNEYILANENTGLLPFSVNGDEVNDLNDYTVDNNELNVTENTETTTEEETTAADTSTTEITETTTSTLDVISRSVMTGTVYDKSSLEDYSFVKSTFYTVTSITSLMPEMLRPGEFLEKDMTITQDSSAPQILIFHTHSQEAFSDSVEGDPSTSIVGVGDYLTQILTEKYGYNVIHDTGVYDLVDGVLDRSKAYTYSEEAVQKILDEYPSIEVVIDLHRDGVDDSTHLVTNIDGKDVAKIMFFNGLSYSNVIGDIGYLYNPYRDDNLAMSLQMHLLGEAYYPGFLRRIYCNAYRYCLYMRAKSMLIEAGAQTNTFEEVKNAMEPLADILDKLLRGEKAY